MSLNRFGVVGLFLPWLCWACFEEAGAKDERELASSEQRGGADTSRRGEGGPVVETSRVSESKATTPSGPDEDGAPAITPGAQGSACDWNGGGCDANLTCRYDLGKGYICQPELEACVQPKVSTQLNVGFIYGDWTLPPAEDYTDVTLDMHPVKTGADNGPLQYFAMGGRFANGPTGGEGFYGGLQTKIGNATPAGGKRGVIFSGFGITDALPAPGSYVAIDRESCDGTPGAVCAQLSAPYDWRDGGTYRLRYHFAGDAPSGPAHRRLRVSVTDVDRDAETVLGDLIVPATWKLPSNYYTFDETFPDNPEICDTYNPSDILYTRLRADGAAGKVTHSDDSYPGPCRNFFHYRPLEDGYRLLLGICLP